MNLLIVEDDPIQINGLIHIINDQYPKISVYTAASYSDAAHIIDSSCIDLFMLDINLGGDKTGLDVCAYLRKKPEYENTPVIFITDIINPSLDVINRYHCSYYFSKPYSRNDVVNAINAMFSATETTPPRLQMRDIQGILFHVVPQDIIYVRSDGHHKHIFTSNGDFIVTNSTFETSVKDNNLPLVRCHKSYYFNPNYILSYDRTNSLLQLSGIQDSIPIGRKYKSQIHQENK